MWTAEQTHVFRVADRVGVLCAQVHVILFGVGDFETEGIYSLRALRREDNLPQDTIIAFEDDDDAERCALLLRSSKSGRASGKKGPCCAQSGSNSV